MIARPIIFTKETDVPTDAVIVDARDSALRELFPIRNPTVRKGTPEFKTAQETFVAESTIPSIYVYYPWLNKAIRMLPEAEYFELRTARNKHVIKLDEQLAYRKGRVAIAGLSVGSAVLHALVMTGGPQYLKIADFDVVEITNLNRLRAGLVHVGESKVEVAARLVWELDPFAEIELFSDGINAENIETFITAPRVDVMIDEMEAIDYKIWTRLIAKREKIPVLMATDNGNGIILDVERFDLEPERPIFHGLVAFSDPSELKNLTFRDWLKLATQIVGPEHLGDRMRESILSIGKTIPSVPQLGTSATFAGSVIAYATRMILTGESLPSGRYDFTLEQLIDPHYLDPDKRALRKASAEDFLRKIQS